MLQRIQTIWLLAASACGFISLKTAFFIGSIGTATASNLTAMSNLLLMIITIVAATLSLVAIFLYKNRGLQLKMVMVAIGLSVLTLVLYFIELKNYTVGGLALGSVIVLVIPVFLVLSSVGIYKDEKLVKSIDRLR